MDKSKLGLSVAVLLVFVLCAMGVKIAFIANLDQRGSAALVDFLHSSLVTGFMLAITNLTLGTFVGALIVVTGLVLNKKLRTAVAFGITSITTYALVELLKLLFQRERPLTAEIFEGKLIASKLTAYSFPSGHSTFAFFITVYLINTIALPRWLKVGLLILSTLVAVSRVYLGVHYLLDCVAGAALGTLCGLVFAELTKIVLVRLRRVHITAKRSSHQGHFY